MRRASIILSSTALSAMFVAASPAFAQDQSVPPTNPGATAQQSPATLAQNADAPESPGTAAGTDNGTAIVVTGQRRALQSARNVKRNSPQIVDAIVAADIGKLPDISVADTAARIPGVQVVRQGGEASQVLVRGLDRPFYTTTYDGRDIFTAETRSVALQDFPSGAIAELEAFKTSTADLIEPGIAGEVNVRSRRPFDFNGFEVDGSFWELHPRQSGDWNPNGNLLITDRWKAGDGEFGALLDFSYTHMHYEDSLVSNAYYVAPSLGPTGLRAPDWPFIEYDEANRYRPSLNGALQWRPNPDLEFYVEGLWQGFREEIENRHFELPIWGGASYSNIVVRPGTDLVESGTVTNPYRGQGWQGGTHNSTNTYQFAAGGSWDHGPLRITADVARTASTFVGDTESVDYNLANNNYSVNFDIGSPGGTPSIQISGLDPTDPNNYLYRGFFEENQKAHGDDVQARMDFDYQTGLSFLPKLQWGVRYVDRNAQRQYGSRGVDDNGLNAETPIVDDPLTYVLFHPGFQGADNAPFPTSWLAPTYQDIQDNVEAMRAYAGFPTTAVPYDPTASFKANEKSLAGYVQANYNFNLGSVAVDGQLGLRGVHADRNIQGTQRSVADDGSVSFTPVNDTTKETYWLPNINARIQFTPEVLLRLAATKTRTRPQFDDLNPSVSIGQSPGASCDATVSVCQVGATGGNPNLKDLKSTNYDASLEYYFSRTGFAAIAGFDHELEGFVTPSTYQLGTLDSYPIEVNAPINSGKGHVRGFEAQINTFFDFRGAPEWLHWFGIQANLTRIDASAKYAGAQELCETQPSGPCRLIGGQMVPDPAVQITRPLLYVSKWSYNIIAMFEHGPLSVRAAYNWRSPYWNDYTVISNDPSTSVPYVLQQKVRPGARLDLSANYTFLNRFTVFADWTNVLSNPQTIDLVRTDSTAPVFDPNAPKTTFPYQTRYQERIISLGVRFSFGGARHAAPAPAPAMIAPAPPAPVVEQPAPDPTPPPPPAATPERG